MASVSIALIRTIPAFGQGRDEAGARALFNEGRQLTKGGRFEEACSKFEAARSLFVSSGLLLNLADCHEHLNRTASAWAEFGDAAVAAANSGRPKDEAEAKRRQAALEQRLSRLVIRASHASPDEVVKRDGAPMDRAAWDSPIPVDPGSHVVAAEAPGRSSWSLSVEVREPGKTVMVDIPELQETAASSPAPDASEALAAGSNGARRRDEATAGATPGKMQRVVGIVIGGVGLVAMGTSGILGLVAKSRWDTANNAHGPSRHTDSVQAGQLADAATVVLGAGAVLTVAGVVVWLTAPKASITVGSNGGSLLLSGTFE